MFKQCTYLYGMSLRLLWLCECGTLLLASFTPHTANSCAEPVKLRSLPRRRDNAPAADVLIDGVFNRKIKNKSIKMKKLHTFTYKKIQFYLCQKRHIWWCSGWALLFCRTAKAEESFFVRWLYTGGQQWFIMFRSYESWITIFLQ